MTAGAAPWDEAWAAERAAEALRYLGRNYPECLENLRVLDEHEEAAHEAAMRGDRDAYLAALRAYMRAGKDAALRTQPTCEPAGTRRCGHEGGRRERGISICPGPMPPGRPGREEAISFCPLLQTFVPCLVKGA